MKLRARDLRFLVPLVACLGGLTWCGSLLVNRTTSAWFEKEVMLRAQLAANGTTRAILPAWRGGDYAHIRDVLVDMTRDERIMAAAACSGDGAVVAATPEFPWPQGCAALTDRLAADEAIDGVGRFGSEALPGGSVHVSLFPMRDISGVVGALVIVQDMSFAERRGTRVGIFLVFAFAVLSLAAAAITLMAQRLSWRDWSRELRRLLTKGSDKGAPEFQPLLQDVRALVERLGEEKEAELHAGRWSPARLKHTLRRHLDGERVIIVANREPYIHDRAADGSIRVLHPASGLVTALEPVMRACSGVWIAHGSGSADRETADAADPADHPLARAP